MFYIFLRYSFVGVTFICAAILLWLPSVASAQNKHRTDTVSISGLTLTSKPFIEKAIGGSGRAKLEWSDGEEKAVMIYDAKKSSRAELLKQIALAGFDNSEYLAPDEAYQNLPAPLRYKRVRKPQWAATINPLIKTRQAVKALEVAGNSKATPLISIMSNYLQLKDALVNADTEAAATAANGMLSELKLIKPTDIPASVTKDWTNYKQQLEAVLPGLGKDSDIEAKRQLFISLSPAMHGIAKAAAYQQPLYYQFCPMANNGKGANWVSQFAEIKNPYYGNMMLNCGQTVETIK